MANEGVVQFASGPMGDSANFNYGSNQNRTNPQLDNNGIANHLNNVDGNAANLNNGTTGNKDANGNPIQGSSPLDSFAELFNNPKPVVGADGKPVVAAPTIFDANATDFANASKNIDVSSALTPEVLKVLNPSGNADSTKALSTFANTIAQSVAAQMLSASTKIAQTGMEMGANKAQVNTIQAITSQAAIDMVTTQLPIFEKPGFAPQLSNVVKQLQAHNPNASPKQISEKAVEYFKAMGATTNKNADDNSGEDSNGLGKFLRSIEDQRR